MPIIRNTCLLEFNLALTLTASQSMNPEVDTYGVLDYHYRYTYSKYEWCLTTDYKNISIWKTLTQHKFTKVVYILTPSPIPGHEPMGLMY